MADTSTFMAIGQVPSIDYGAVYRNAKARRELEEERKLQYLNQFQQERGAFTEGMQDELQAEWDAIEADLDAGDMSFEAKARRQRLYNQYKQHAADALDYANNINNLEAAILANPDSYNDPASIMQQLSDARQVQVSGGNIPMAAEMLPSLNEFRRFSLPEISPNAAAGMILENLKSSGGINNFYDMAGEGQLSPEQVASSVTAWFNSNALSQEEEDQAIAFVLHQLGGLTGSMEDLSKIRNLSDEDREKYIGQYAQYVTGALTNMLADDIETQKEKDARELRDFQTRTRIQAEESAKASAASGGDYFNILSGDVQYVPPIEENESGVAIKVADPELANANFQVHALIEGTQPSYMDEFGNTYYIESIGIDSNGQSVAVVRTNQKVKNRQNKTETHVARTAVPLSDIPMTGLSNASQANKIQNTYDKMLGYWSQNLAGQPAANASVYQGDIDALAGLEPEQGPMVSQPSAPQRPFTERFPAPTEGKYDVTVDTWKNMNSGDQERYIRKRAIEENSEMIVSNPKTGFKTAKWNTLTAKERKAEEDRIRKELQMQLNIEV